MSLCKERAWKTLEELSFIRVTGTEDELKAAKMLQQYCADAGVEAVLEEFEINAPEIESASFEVTAPFKKEYHVIGYGRTGSTDDEGVEAPLVYCEEGRDYNLVDVKDKIVLLQGFVKPDVFKKLKEKGALGFVLLTGSFYDEQSIKEELRPRFNREENCELPGVVMHISDAEDLLKSRPETVKLTLKQDSDRKAIAHNVIATIEGTDLKEDIIVFTAHYDSVAYSRGVWDNGTGSVSILELMRHFKENQPRRTMKFVWCGAEEIGLCGSRAYCEAHKDELEKVIYNINFDMTGVILGHDVFCNTGSDATKYAVDYLAKVNEFPCEVKNGCWSSDSTSFALAGVPSCSFARMMVMGGASFHNHYDNFDHLDADVFMKTLNFSCLFATNLANTTVRLVDRTFAKEVSDELETWKKRFAKKEDKKDDKKEEEKK